MYKHLLKPYDRSYSNGNETIDSYKCEYCNAVISARYKITELDWKMSKCTRKTSSSTLKEDIKKTYDCTILHESLYYKWMKFRDKIKSLIRLR